MLVIYNLASCGGKRFHSPWRGDAIWCHRSWWSLVQLMTARFLGANTLHEPMMIYYWNIGTYYHQSYFPHDDVIKWKHFPRHWSVTGEFPAQRPVTRSFDVFFDLRLNKRLSKQWCGWWFETPSRPLWRHSNAIFPTLWPSSLIYHHYMQCYAELFAVSL